MSVTLTDGLFTFGTQEVVQIPTLGIGYAADTTAKAPLGILYRYNGNVYRYVYYVSTVASVENSCCYWSSLDPLNGLYQVSAANGVGIAGINSIAGFFPANATSYVAATTATYIWIQVGGVVPKALLKDGSAGLGAKCFGVATDGTLDYVAAGTAATGNVVGVVIGAVITSVHFPVLLQGLC